MVISVEVLITCVSVAWSAGLVIGMFSSKFMSKKECACNQKKLWERIDAVTDSLVGGKIAFELRQTKRPGE